MCSCVVQMEFLSNTPARSDAHSKEIDLTTNALDSLITRLDTLVQFETKDEVHTRLKELGQVDELHREIAELKSILTRFKQTEFLNRATIDKYETKRAILEERIVKLNITKREAKEQDADLDVDSRTRTQNMITNLNRKIAAIDEKITEFDEATEKALKKLLNARNVALTKKRGHENEKDDQDTQGTSKLTKRARVN